MKHAGMHWPTGGEHPSRAAIYELPGVQNGCLLMLADSARYWYSEARQMCPLVVWRGLPRIGRRPAELGWNPDRVAIECLNLWDEQPHNTGTEWFLPLNELQFEFENGGPFPGYGEMAKNLGRLRGALRSRIPGVKLMFPAWVPSDEGNHLGDWVDEASKWDSICLHVYGYAHEMGERYDSYRDQFPDHPIFVGEWNDNHTGADLRTSLEMWAGMAATDPLLQGVTYYIWQTQRQGEVDLSVWPNPDRVALFQNPPGATVPEPKPEPEPKPMPSTDLPQGLDVASYQGYPDWNAVAAAGYVFAITKVTEDDGYVNPTFAYNWSGIKAAGMIRGAYHFARPGFGDAEAEANYFLDMIDQHGGLDTGDLLALDLEAGFGDLGQWTLDFLRHCELRCGFKPLVYTGAWFSGPHNLASYPEIGQYGLWLAAYQAQMPAPPPPWDTVAFWQYTSSGQVPSIGGDVDLNVFNGPADRIMLYGKPASSEPIPPEPPTYAVGPGILAAMQEHGDSPATDEAYYGQEYSEAFGMSGSRYTYLKATNRTYRFDPAG